MEKSDSNSSFEKESPPRHNNGSENEEEIDQILNERIRGKGVIYKFVGRFEDAESAKASLSKEDWSYGYTHYKLQNKFIEI